MGPENYAFFLGNEVVIVLDNIIYDTNFKCRIGYTDQVMSWVEGLLEVLPADAGLSSLPDRSVGFSFHPRPQAPHQPAPAEEEDDVHP